MSGISRSKTVKMGCKRFSFRVIYQNSRISNAGRECCAFSYDQGYVYEEEAGEPLH